MFVLGSIQNNYYLVNVLFAVPKCSFLQTLIRLFPTLLQEPTQWSEIFGQRFSSHAVN